MKQIPLSQGKFALVDDEDYDFLMQWKWCAYRNKNTDIWYSLRKKHPGKGNTGTVRMHRQVLNAKNPKVHIDHINGNGLDNRKSNLRLCTPCENQRNRRAKRNGISGLKGVVYNKYTEKWQARITINGKIIHLGQFEFKNDAGKAYDNAAKEHFGEFARLNFSK